MKLIGKEKPVVLKQLVALGFLVIALVCAVPLVAAADESESARPALDERMEPIWLESVQDERGKTDSEGLSIEHMARVDRKRADVVLRSDAIADAFLDFSHDLSGFIRIVDRTKFMHWRYPSVGCEGPDDALWHVPTVMMFQVWPEEDRPSPFVSAITAYAAKYNAHMADLMDFSARECQPAGQAIPDLERLSGCDLALGDERATMSGATARSTRTPSFRRRPESSCELARGGVR